MTSGGNPRNFRPIDSIRFDAHLLGEGARADEKGEYLEHYWANMPWSLVASRSVLSNMLMHAERHDIDVTVEWVKKVGPAFEVEDREFCEEFNVMEEPDFFPHPHPWLGFFGYQITDEDWELYNQEMG